MSLPAKLVTIGVFGFTEEGFFRTLQNAQVDIFCDIRQRRAVRGSTYAFVNSERLQRRLAELGIRYIHLKELAPTPAIREQQHQADKTSKTAKRQRSALSPSFVTAYERDILGPFEPETFLQKVGTAETIALFCVEREPAACHRSLVAGYLHQKLGVEIEHLLP